MKAILKDGIANTGVAAVKSAVHLSKCISLLLDQGYKHAETVNALTHVSFRCYDKEGSESKSDVSETPVNFLSPIKVLTSLFSVADIYSNENEANPDNNLPMTTNSRIFQHSDPESGYSRESRIIHSPPIAEYQSRLSRIWSKYVLDLWTTDYFFEGLNCSMPSSAENSRILVPPSDNCFDSVNVKISQSPECGANGYSHPLWHINSLSKLQSNVRSYGHNPLSEDSTCGEGNEGDAWGTFPSCAIGCPSPLLLEIIALLVDVCDSELAIGQVSFERSVLKQFITTGMSKIVSTLGEHKSASEGKNVHHSTEFRKEFIVVGRILMLQEVLLDACYLQQVAKGFRLKSGSSKKSGLMSIVTSFMRSSSFSISDLLLYAPLSTPEVTLGAARLISKLVMFSNSAPTNDDDLFTDAVMQICLSAYTSAFQTALMSEGMITTTAVDDNGRRNVDDYMQILQPLCDASAGGDSMFLVICPSDLHRLLYCLRLMKVWGGVFMWLLSDLYPNGGERISICAGEVVRVLDMQVALLRLFNSMGGNALHSSLNRNLPMMRQSTLGKRQARLRMANEVSSFGLAFLMEPILQSMRRLTTTEFQDCSKNIASKSMIDTTIKLCRDFWSLQAIFDLSNSHNWWQKLEDKFSVALTQNALGQGRRASKCDMMEDTDGRSVMSGIDILVELQNFVGLIPVLVVGIVQKTPPLVSCGGMSGGEAMGYFLHQLGTTGLIKTLLSQEGSTSRVDNTQRIIKGKWVDDYTSVSIYKLVKENDGLFPHSMDRVVPSSCVKVKASTLPPLVDCTRLGVVLFATAVRYLESIRVSYLQEAYTFVLLYLRDTGVENSPLLVKLLMDISQTFLLPLFEKRILKITIPLRYPHFLPLECTEAILHRPTKAVAATITQCLHGNASVRVAAYMYLKGIFASQACPSLFWDTTALSALLQCLEALDKLDGDINFVHSTVPLPLDDFFSVNILSHSTRCNFITQLPNMSFPRHDKLALVAVAQPFLIMAYEWLAVAIRLQPWLTTPFMEEYLLRYEERGDVIDCLSTSMVQEIHDTKVPTFHLCCRVNGASQSLIKEARRLAALTVAFNMNCAATTCAKESSPRRNFYCGNADARYALRSFFGPKLFLKIQDVVYYAFAYDEPSSSLLPSVAMKAKYNGKMGLLPQCNMGHRAFASSFQAIHSQFLSFAENFRILLEKGSDDSDDGLWCNVVHNIRLGSCIVRNLYLTHRKCCVMAEKENKGDDEVISTQLMDCTVTLLAFFEQLINKSLLSSDVFSALRFAWEWLLCVPHLVESDIDSRTYHFPLSSLVISNILICFRRSAEVNLGMFSSVAQSFKSISVSDTESRIIGPRYPTRATILSPVCGKSEGTTVGREDCPGSHCCCSVDVHVAWVTFLFELFLSENHLCCGEARVKDQLMTTLGRVLSHFALQSFYGVTMIARFHLLTFSLRMLTQSSQMINSKAQCTSSTSRQYFAQWQRRILREKIYSIAFAAFSHVDASFPAPPCGTDDNKEEEVLRFFLRALRVDLLTAHSEYSVSHENTAAGECSRGNGILDNQNTTILSHLRPLLMTPSEISLSINCATSATSIGEQKCNESSFFTSQNLIEGINEVGSLLILFVLNRLDMLSSWSANSRPPKSVSTFKNKNYSPIPPLHHNSMTLADALLLPDVWYQSMICTAWQIAPIVAISLVERFRFRLTNLDLSVSSGAKSSKTCCFSSIPAIEMSPFDTLRSLILFSPESASNIPRAAELVLLNKNGFRLDKSKHTVTFLSDHEELRLPIDEKLRHWATFSLPTVLNIWSRLPIRFSEVCPAMNSIFVEVSSERKKKSKHTKSNSEHAYNRRTKTHKNESSDIGEILESHSSSNLLHESKPVVQLLLRSLKRYTYHSCDIKTLEFYLPQLVQLLRRDPYGVLAEFIADLAKMHTLICHRLVWLLQVEINSPKFGSGEVGMENDILMDDSAHGYGNSLQGSDPLPSVAARLLHHCEMSLSPRQLAYLHQECDFFDRVTNISATLKNIPDKTMHNRVIADQLSHMPLSPGLYLPTDSMRKVIGVLSDSGVPMQSAAKCPFLLLFKTESWTGPCDDVNGNVEMLATETTSNVVNGTPLLGRPKTVPINPLKTFNSPKLYGSKAPMTPNQGGPGLFLEDNYDSKGNDDIDQWREGSIKKLIHKEEIEVMLQDESTSSEEGQSDSEIEACTEEDDQGIDFVSRLSTILYNTWKYRHLHSLERFRKDRKVLSNKSTYPARSHDQNVEACIFKVYDDCRQDAITIQVIRILRDVNDCLGIPSFLVPYTVIPNRTGNDNAHGGIVQVISDVKSRDQIGKEGFKTLLQLFESRFGPVGTAEFRAAQMEFCRSMAGYAVVCYLLQIKDRHNGNILIDKLGHIIHIDFGFLLGISPGGNLGFESAAFKFSNEMMELLSVEVDGYAHGVKKCPCESSAFKYFVLLTLRGFLAARAVMDQILVCDVISERC